MTRFKVRRDGVALIVKGLHPINTRESDLQVDENASRKMTSAIIDFPLLDQEILKSTGSAEVSQEYIN